MADEVTADLLLNEDAPSLNEYDAGNVNKCDDGEQLTKTKCAGRCRTKRECCCCAVGLFMSLIIVVAGFLVFISISAKSITPDSIGKPSKTVFIRHQNSSGPNYIFLEWKSPVSTGGAFLTSYTLQYKLSARPDFTTILMVDQGSQKHHNVTNLNGSTVYDFRITANNLAGYSGNWSDIYVQNTKPSIKPQPPQPPFPMNIHNFSAENIVALTMGFEPSSNGGSAIILYTIYYGINNGNGDNKTVYKPFCNVTSAEISSLSSFNYPNCTGNLTSSQLSKLLHFRVNSSNIVGRSVFSAYTPCIIPQENINEYMCSLYDVPSIIANSSFDVKVASYEIDMEWATPGCKEITPVLEYQLQRDEWWMGTGLANVSIPNNGLSLYAQLDGLLAGITYNIQIRAINKYGGGPWSALQITTAELASCGNYYDTNIYRQNCRTIPVSMNQIWLSCNGNDNCQTTKIKNQFGFSDDCIVCQVETNDCLMDQCFQECMHEVFSKCTQCVQTKCYAYTVTCTGWPKWPLTCA